MKKYFTYSNENISGLVYWIRQILNLFLIMFFGLGIYLMGLTAYKRAKAFDMSHSNAILMSIFLPICLFIAGSLQYTDYWPWANLFMLPHAIFVLKNGNKKDRGARAVNNPLFGISESDFDKAKKEWGNDAD